MINPRSARLATVSRLDTQLLTLDEQMSLMKRAPKLAFSADRQHIRATARAGQGGRPTTTAELFLQTS